MEKINVDRVGMDVSLTWARRLCLFVCFMSASVGFATGYGEYVCHTDMPALPASSADYENMWDPFVLRASKTGIPFSVVAEKVRDSKDVVRSVETNDFQFVEKIELKNSLRVLSGFDALPWNARQIVRDSEGNWFVLVEQAGGKIFLATGNKNNKSPRRPRGGDLQSFELIGDSQQSVIRCQKGVASHASMAFDGSGQLHVVWHTPKGLWHTQTVAKRSSVAKIHESSAWTAPRKLADFCCHGDILRDHWGNVAVSYSKDDTVYFLPLSDKSLNAEVVGGLKAGMEMRKRPGCVIPLSERESQDSVMDVAQDGSVWLAFRRDFSIWVARRSPQGKWDPPEQVTREYVFHPSIMVVGNRPLVAFLHEGLRRIPLDIGESLEARAGGGAAVGYAVRTGRGWKTGAIVSAEEIPVFRRGMWSQRGKGRIYPQIEQLGWPVMFRDTQGVVWAMWQNTTRRWAYCARWQGESFGQVHECRGPFNAPCLPVNAEKHAPSGVGDVGLLFYAAAGGGYNRAIFDRLVIPSLSIEDDREILFLDSLEVSETVGTDFVLNQMTKPSTLPSVSPRSTEMIAWGAHVGKRGDTYVMEYSSPEGGKTDGNPQYRVAVSKDGVHFENVSSIPKGLPPETKSPRRPLAYWHGMPENTPPKMYENPDSSDPQKKYVRLVFSKVNRNAYALEYSPDGKTWGEEFPISVMDAMRERAMPNFFDANDIERPIRAYSRVYSETGRSWGLIWSRDLLNWSGLEHLLDVDDPYTKSSTGVAITDFKKDYGRYTMRGQLYIDAAAGKGEDEIYGSSVRLAEDLYFCFYWPGMQGRPLTGVGVAVSRDGSNFTRIKNGERILPVGPPGAWDAGYIFQMYPMVDGDTVRVYYRGTAGCREGTDGFNHNLTEIGLALIRVNGWTYYTPRIGCDNATVTTIPIRAPTGTSRGLTVNITGVTGKKSAFSAEVLDAATGKVIEGFGASDCRMPAEDGLAVPIVWRGGNLLPSGRDLRLRFHLMALGTRLYSFGFHRQEVIQ